MVGCRHYTTSALFLVLFLIDDQSVESFAICFHKSRVEAVYSKLQTLDNDHDDSETDPTSSNNSAASKLSSDIQVPATPCVRICRYNADFYGGAVCTGCFREAFEIGIWAGLDRQERLYALQDALDRLDSVNSSSGGDDDPFEGSIDRKELEAMIKYYRNPK